MLYYVMLYYMIFILCYTILYYGILYYMLCYSMIYVIVLCYLCIITSLPPSLRNAQENHQIVEGCSCSQMVMCGFSKTNSGGFGTHRLARICTHCSLDLFALQSHGVLDQPAARNHKWPFDIKMPSCSCTSTSPSGLPPAWQVRRAVTAKPFRWGPLVRDFSWYKGDG